MRFGSLDPVLHSALRPDPRPGAQVLTPRIELLSAKATLDDGSFTLRERHLPLARLRFEDRDGILQEAPRRLPFDGLLDFDEGGENRESSGDRDAEDPQILQARRVLESFGAIELACIDELALPPDVEADYVLSLEEDALCACAWAQHIVPQLRMMGWKIAIQPDFSFQTVDARSVFAKAEPHATKEDWFSLELGVVHQGQRVSLLDPLLSLLKTHGAEGLQSLDHELRRGIALRLNPTHWVTLDPTLLRAILSVLVELYEGDGMRVDFPAIRAESLDVFDALGLREEPEAAPTLRLVESDAPPSERPAPKPPPKGLRATLRDYQLEGLAWMRGLYERGHGGILADDMGLGKTLQTIAHLLEQHEAGPSLVIAPTSLVANWKRELKRFAPSLKVAIYRGARRAKLRDRLHEFDIVLSSYPILLRDEESLCALAWNVLVLDEAHAIKSARSKTRIAATHLEAAQRLCLSGTPVENHLGELWSLVDFVQPELLGSETRFRSWFRVPIEEHRDELRMEALRHAIAPILLRRTKREVVSELPSKTRILRPIELRGKQRELYESVRLSAHASVRQAILERGLSQSTVPILGALMKLRQVCCDPRLLRMDAARDVRESAKLRACMELIESQRSGGHRMLLFSQFTSMLAILSDALSDKRIAHLILTGETRDRQALCDHFERGQGEVFLISLKAGGTGLNLVSADTVIHYDPWWNPQAREQATDRAYRIGQTKSVFTYDLFVAGSVEERILSLQRDKQRLAESLLEGAPLASEEVLGLREVETLFAPLKG